MVTIKAIIKFEPLKTKTMSQDEIGSLKNDILTKEELSTMATQIMLKLWASGNPRKDVVIHVDANNVDNGEAMHFTLTFSQQPTKQLKTI